MITLLAAAAATIAVPPPIAPAAPRYLFVEYRPGEVRCDGAAVRAEGMAPVIPRALYQRAGRDPDVPVARTLGFRIDETGRPLSIHEAGSGGGTGSEDDIAAALSASRFSAGAARNNCLLSYTPAVATPETARLGAVAHYLAVPHEDRGPDRALFARLRPEVSDCDGTPLRRITVYPDFQAMEGQAGRFSWAALDYDVTAAGAPADVRLVASSGDSALDAAATDAIGQWRFVRGHAATGCPYTFWKAPGPVLAAPERPESDPGLPPERCEAGGEWADLPPLARFFPDAFRRRRIEGWAVVRFDVASWGATGKAEVLAAEPAEAFGEAARRLIEAGRKPESPRGAIGCVQTVRFALPDGEAAVQGDRY